MIKIFKKKETDTERIIRHADTLVLNSDYTGELDKSCLDIFREARDHNTKKLSPPLEAIRKEIGILRPDNFINGGYNMDILSKYIDEKYNEVRTHLLTYNYIDKPDSSTQKWILNEEGKLMKRYGGHIKYQTHKDREIRAIKGDQSSKINFWFRKITEWVAVGIIGFFTRYMTEQKPKAEKSKEIPEMQKPQIKKNPIPAIRKDTT